MTQIQTNQFILLVACALPWIIAGWVRIPRYARYLQLEGYENKRYLRWFFRQDAEKDHLKTLLGFAFVLFLCAVAELFFIHASSPTIEFIIAFIILVVAASLAWYFAPKDREIKQKFTPTQRAVRLIVTAFIVEIIPVIIIGVVSWLWGRSFTGVTVSSPEAARRGAAVFVSIATSLTVVAGVISYILTPFTLPIANILMWPVEEVFRRYYLRLAKQHLKRSGATVIAITGSYGKTSTKHYLHHILEGRYRVLMTPKSYNTLLGISRVINEILAKDVSYDYFLVEAGAYIPGEIARICKLVEPQISIVVTVGPMHLERFGTIENVVKAKYEIIEALPPDGVGVFNADDPRVRSMAERGYPQNRLLVTRQEPPAPGARLSATNVHMTADGLDFDVRDNQTDEARAMHAPLYGEHNVTNMLLAMAVAHHLGMSLSEIALRVATLQPAEHRLNRRVMPDGTILIDDAYSANPVGTQAALDVLALQDAKPGARRIVVSSGMFELGPLYVQENRILGKRIARVATDVILIGMVQTQPVLEGLRAQAFPPAHLHVVDTLSEAVAIYKPLLRPGDVLLVLTDLPDTYA